MIYSEEEILIHIQKKFRNLINRKKLDTNFELFLSEIELFSELGAESEEEKQQIRIIASSAIDGFNCNSSIKIDTDIDDNEMLEAENYRKKNIEPFLPNIDNYYESTRTEPATEWLKYNILSSGYRRNPDLPGPFFTLFLIGFCILIAFLDLGSAWYEIALKIIAFIMALSFGGIIYAIITNIVTRSNFYFKRAIHLILFLLFPLIFYICLRIYFLY